MNEGQYYPEITQEEIETGQYYHAIQVQAIEVLTRVRTEMIIIVRNADVFECALSLAPEFEERQVEAASDLIRFAFDPVKGYAISLAKPLNELM